jgi:hypothetical protein
MENRKTPLECCQTLSMASIVEEKKSACKKDSQREGKVFSSTDFSSGDRRIWKDMPVVYLENISLSLSI